MSENATNSSRADWVRPVVLAASCLVLGFVAGWALRGGEESPIVIPQAAAEPTQTTREENPPAPPPAATDTTATAPQTTTEVEPPPPPPPTLPEAATIKVAVLNGSGVTGLAGRTATQIEGLGYSGVTPGNTTGQTGPTIVYYRPEQELAARKVAQDLGYGLSQVKELTAAVPAGEAPADAQVIVVLGPG